MNTEILKHSKKSLPLGARFGRWTVADPDFGRSKTGQRLVRCKCDCGNEGLVVSSKLKNGWSTSCGCFAADRARDLHTKHGLSKTPTYNTWLKIRDRCQNLKNAKYPDYGGRGIQVCDRWQAFDNFLADMGMKPGREFSIDRYPNNDGNYEPGNCRWATAKEQANNRRVARKPTKQGQAWH